MTSTEQLALRSPQFRLWLSFVQEHLESLGVSYQYAQQHYSFAQAWEYAMNPYHAADNCAQWLMGRR